MKCIFKPFLSLLTLVLLSFSVVTMASQILDVGPGYSTDVIVLDAMDDGLKVSESNSLDNNSEPNKYNFLHGNILLKGTALISGNPIFYILEYSGIDKLMIAVIKPDKPGLPSDRNVFSPSTIAFAEGGEPCPAVFNTVPV